jgi:hypothetical protein
MRSHQILRNELYAYSADTDSAYFKTVRVLAPRQIRERSYGYGRSSKIRDHVGVVYMDGARAGCLDLLPARGFRGLEDAKLRRVTQERYEKEQELIAQRMRAAVEALKSSGLVEGYDPYVSYRDNRIVIGVETLENILKKL